MSHHWSVCAPSGRETQSLTLIRQIFRVLTHFNVPGAHCMRSVLQAHPHQVEVDSESDTAGLEAAIAASLLDFEVSSSLVGNLNGPTNGDRGSHPSMAPAHRDRDRLGPTLGTLAAGGGPSGGEG